MAHKFYLVELREEDYTPLGVYFTLEAAEGAKAEMERLYPERDPIICKAGEMEELRSKTLFGKGKYGDGE